MNYLKQKDLALLAGNTVTITKVFPSYRKWWNDKAKQFETFKLVDGKWQEEKWVDGQRVLEQREPSFQLHKKVYDIVVKTDREVNITVEQWNKDSKMNEEVEILGDEFTIKELGATKIKGIAEATVAFGKVPTKEDGTPAYDWEDKFVDDLAWVSVTFSTKKAKMNNGEKDIEYTEYMFREVPWAKQAKKDEEDGLPF